MSAANLWAVPRCADRPWPSRPILAHRRASRRPAGLKGIEKNKTWICRNLGLLVDNVPRLSPVAFTLHAESCRLASQQEIIEVPVDEHSKRVQTG
jgi:hypothetical protein